jgi:ADP-dependent phosphofructokinase/glucokinase
LLYDTEQNDQNKIHWIYDTEQNDQNKIHWIYDTEQNNQNKKHWIYDTEQNNQNKIHWIYDTEQNNQNKIFVLIVLFCIIYPMLVMSLDCQFMINRRFSIALIVIKMFEKKPESL